MLDPFVSGYLTISMLASLGNAFLWWVFSQGVGEQGVEIDNEVVVSCGCDRTVFEKRFGIGGYFGKRNEDILKIILQKTL